MHWQQLTLRLMADDLPRVEALLRLAGCHALSVADDGDEPILEPAAGSTPLWPRVVLQALFSDSADLAQIAAIVGNEAESLEIERIADEDWIGAWRQTVAPIRLGRLDIVPADDASPAQNRLILNMGLAFGTGRHPTTRLCLDWLVREIHGGETVLDYGAGSGILALAALRLGARFAWATDDDPQAVEAAEQNARANRLDESIWIGSPEALDCGHVDVIVANILAGPLTALAPTFARLQASHARLVLSGILPEQVAEIEAAYAGFYDSLAVEYSDGWSLVSGSRRAVSPGPEERAQIR